MKNSFSDCRDTFAKANAFQFCTATESTISNYRDAVGIMIINPKKKLFLAYRAWTQTSKYHWQMPQGGIDEGETPEQAAWREMYEETGLMQANCQLIAQSQNWYTYDIPKKTKHKIDGERQKWFLFLFKGTN